MGPVTSIRLHCFLAIFGFFLVANLMKFSVLIVTIVPSVIYQDIIITQRAWHFSFIKKMFIRRPNENAKKLKILLQIPGDDDFFALTKSDLTVLLRFA